MATSEKKGEINLQYFQRQKLLWLWTFLQGRGIQTSSEGKCKRKAELVELAFNAHSVNLPKVTEGESENENHIMGELLATDKGVLPDPASILKLNWSRNLSIFPEVTFPGICNYLLPLALFQVSYQVVYFISCQVCLTCRRTFTFRKRSIGTIRVTFQCCLFLAAKVWVIMV